MVHTGRMVPILILAAGASSRMAPRDKLTEPVDGEPLLRRTARTALATGAPVICALPTDRPARRATLDGLTLRIIEVPEAAQGMSASLRAGLSVLPADAIGVMILPADLPALTGDDLARCLAAFAAAPGLILRATAETGRPGHPAIFPADLIPVLATVTGDEGGRSVLAAHRDRTTLLPLPGNRATLDLDTPGDWAAFRASRGE
jgi:molybdenum cofactor cytidylyltransferase